ncbi:unnamed protein product [Aphanomyces euteiches]|uniref:Dipeptidase n=1 Tax=Aphanomyces euteiches TaxID=100861 RepID=A0A6G0XHX0_9STRA|nr:hypothetical protein Ae201684_004685 [Aphanomyces euteiches]KAH9144771.1 hypothetical protein AeRB84_011307 [Aphanomyces euteiches]
MKLGLWLVAAASAVADACTMVAVGKAATVDGSTIVTHNDDAGTDTADLRLVVIQAKQHDPQSQRPVYKLAGGYPRVVAAERSPQYAAAPGQNHSIPLGHIPEVETTYSYIAQEYAIVNQVQLSIGESTCNARTTGWPTSIPGGRAMFGLGELTSIAMERCDSARCAVKLMGALAEAHGFYGEYGGTPDNPGYDSEALGITDRYGEVWIFHILAGFGGHGAIWAAQRVPDDHVAVVANHFTIGEMNLADPDWYLASDNVITTAIDQGWYTPKNNETFSDFNFKAAYAKPPPLNSHGPVLYTDGRTWRIYSTLAPSANVSATFGYMDAFPDYPFSVRVDQPVSLDDITKLLRDQYQGTQYDLTQGLAAGPFGNPLRYSGFTPGVHGAWMNPISVHRTLYSYAVQANQATEDEAPFGTLWFGQSAPHGTVFLPFSCSQTSLPKSFHDDAGKQGQFQLGSAWWAFNFVNNWRTLRYDLIGQDVNAFIESFQNQAYALVKNHRGQQNLTTVYNDFAQKVVDARWDLAWKLVSKYSDGYVTPLPEGKMVAPGYPAWWLNQTNYVQWSNPSTVDMRGDQTSYAVGTSFVWLVGGFGCGLAANVLYRNRRRHEYFALP